MVPRKGPGGAFEQDVDGETYTFSKLGAIDSLSMLAEISDLVGGPLAGVFANLKQGVKTEITADLAATVLGGLTAKLRSNKQAVIDVLKMLCSGDSVLCNGRAVKSFDQHYEGRLDHLFKVAYAALEVQYGSFFDAARTFLEAAGKQADSASTQAIPTSIG